MKKTKAYSRWLAVLLALFMVFGLMPASALAADNSEYTVFISFEGFNLGHGFYIEPTAISVPSGSTAMDVTSILLNQTGHEYSLTAWGGLDRIQGFHPGGPVTPPAHITIELTSGAGDGSLGSFDYSEYSGWMYTVNHTMADVGADAFVVSDGDVIRWQFSVQGWGGDLGLGEDRGFWTAPLFEHADKTRLIQALFAEGAAAGARGTALDVIIDPVATPEAVASVILLLLDSDAVEYITVFISFEGFNLGHGFYVEPAAKSVPSGSSAMDVTLALLNQRGHNYSMTAWGGLDRIYGFHPGGPVNPPAYITIALTSGAGDGSLGSFDYSGYSGWMYTVNHIMADVGADAFVVSYGDVIRWQFSVEGWGADLGLGTDRGFWTDPLYAHADKSQLIRDLPGMGAGARQDALAVIINPLATPQEVAAGRLIEVTPPVAPAPEIPVAVPAIPAGLTGIIPPAPVAGQNLLYTVQPGETLWSIAFNFYGSMQGAVVGRILNANRGVIPSNQVLQAGMVITLPAQGLRDPITRTHINNAAGMYLVRSGDNLSTIAYRFLGSTAAWGRIFEANRDRIRNANRIYEGQWLVIPR